MTAGLSVCPWCGHSTQWHYNGRLCGFPDCGCVVGHVKPDDALTGDARAVLDLLRADGPLRTASITKRLGWPRAAYGYRQRSRAANAVDRLSAAGRARRLGGKWHAVEIDEVVPVRP
jgi:hypothetical protein